MSLAELEPPAKSAAPGQYLGFSLQQLRACHHLFSAPDGDSVSLEHLDDVARHRADGTVFLEQDKSTLKGNPAADRSPDLWKTFANWASLCAAGKVVAETTDFHLYITPFKTGALVSQIDAASDKDASAKVLAKIAKLVDPKDPTAGCSPHVQTFLNAGPEICAAIIRRFVLVSETDATDSVRQFVRVGVPASAVEDLTAAAIGLARARFDRLIRDGKPPIVTADVFRRQFQAFLRRSNLATYLVSKADMPASALVAEVVGAAPIFVRQLQAIEASPDLLTTAVSDFLRTTADKVEWAEEGLVLADSFDQLDGELLRKHGLIRDEIEDEKAHLTDTAKGRSVYRRCSDVTLPLDGQTLPTHFIAGAFNGLADGLRLGWHPAYKTMFPGDSE